jgi:hypothetical protein
MISKNRKSKELEEERLKIFKKLMKAKIYKKHLNKMRKFKLAYKML